jgi:hypothetical protein
VCALQFADFSVNQAPSATVRDELRKNQALTIRGKRRRFAAPQTEDIIKVSDRLKLLESEAARLILSVGDESSVETAAADKGVFAAALELFYEERVVELRVVATLLKVRLTAVAAQRLMNRASSCDLFLTYPTTFAR